MPPASIPLKVERQSRPTQVAEAIKQWVMEQRLSAGDRLPGEAELIARFGMSKGTIREATRILEAQGLVRTRTGPGGGTFLHKIGEDRARALLANYFYFRDLTLDEVYRMRQLLEPEMAAALAGRLTEAQLAELEAIVAGYCAPSQDAQQERDQHVASLQFHARLAEWSDNPLLGFLVGFIAKMLTEMTVARQLYDPPNVTLWQQGLEHQRALITALRDGDAEAARQTMADHMATAHKLMQDQQVELVRRFVTESVSRST